LNLLHVTLTTDEYAFIVHINNAEKVTGRVSIEGKKAF